MIRDRVEVKVSRRRKTISIQILPDNSVRILSPVRLAGSALQKILHEKEQWIEKIRLRNAKAREGVVPFNPVDGGEFQFLGSPIRIQAQGKTDGLALLENRTLFISLKGCRLEPSVCLENRILQWCRERAMEILETKVQTFSEKLGRPVPDWNIRTMKSRWGSCSADGRISFNWKIVFAPESVIDYLVVHELAHLVEHNHSPRFWSQVARLLPDFEGERLWLRNHGKYLISGSNPGGGNE